MVVLIVDTGAESKAARSFLHLRGVRFKETTENRIPYGPTYKAPTLLNHGEAFRGLDEIKIGYLLGRYL